MAEKTLEEMRQAVAGIREKMAAAAREAGRDPAAVQLCAACKTRTAKQYWATSHARENRDIIFQGELR